MNPNLRSDTEAIPGRCRRPIGNDAIRERSICGVSALIQNRTAVEKLISVDESEPSPA